MTRRQIDLVQTSFKKVVPIAGAPATEACIALAGVTTA